MASFNKVKFNMIRGNGYGQYYITSRYKGVDIKVHTTNSDAWDWVNDDSNKEKHRDALKYCYNKIVQKFKNCTL